MAATTTAEAPHIDPERGLSSAEVAERVARGQVNDVPAAPTRTVGQIVRANVFTRFNAILGVMLAIILVVGPLQDALFGIVLIANAGIGIVQELRAKRTLDRLTLLTAPRARVVRDGDLHEVAVGDVVLDDVLDVGAGSEIVVDGEVLASRGLEVDESLLTGESDAVEKSPADEVLSGSFVAAGAGRYRATKVGAEAYAVQLAEDARRFTLTRSELRSGIDTILTYVTWAIVPTAALLFVSQMRARDDWREAMSGAVAGTVAMVPEGLVLLTSLAFAVAVVRLAQRKVLVQELPAVEGLARIDVLCIDKTGTLTEGKLAVQQVDPLDGEGAGIETVLAALAAADPSPNATTNAIAERFPDPPGWRATDGVAFSSSRKWSASAFEEQGVWFLGAPDVMLAAVDGADELRDRVRGFADQGHRVLLVARAQALTDEQLPPDLEPAGLVVLGDRPRPDAADTLRYFKEQDVTVKVISGDDPRTVGAIAGQLGLDGADEPIDARELSEEQGELAEVLESHSVFGRVTPQQKRSMVQALQSRGHTVAMTGDGVNDALALKDADIGVAMGSGSDATRAVAQLVLLDSTFDSLPPGGRRGPPRARQHRAHERAVPEQDRVRDADLARDRRARVRLPVPAAAPDLDRGRDDRHPVVLPGARAQHRPLPPWVRATGAAVRDPDRHARVDRDPARLLARSRGTGRHADGGADHRGHGAHVDRIAGADDPLGAPDQGEAGSDLDDGGVVHRRAHVGADRGVLRARSAPADRVARRVRHRGDRLVVRPPVRAGGGARRSPGSRRADRRRHHRRLA